MRGVWVYKIGSSSFFNNIIPGKVTSTRDTVHPEEPGENAEPRYSGMEFTEGLPYEGKIIPTVIRTPEIIRPEPTVREEIAIPDESHLTYIHQPPQSNNPHNVYPLPRGPRPVNPPIVILDERDEDIDVNGEILAVCPYK